MLGLPRISPDPALRSRIFSSPEFFELTGTFDISSEAYKSQTVPKLPASHSRRDTPGRPQLVAIPGGRSTTPTPSVQPSPSRQSWNSRTLRTLFVVLAATIILAVGIGSFLGFNSCLVPSQPPNNGAITPPTHLLPNAP